MIRFVMCAIAALMAGVLASGMSGNPLVGLAIGVVAGIIGLIVTKGMD